MHANNLTWQKMALCQDALGINYSEANCLIAFKDST